MPSLRHIKNPGIRTLAELVALFDDDGEEISAQTNEQNRDLAIREWQLGPEKTSIDPKANAKFWQGLSAALNMGEKEARRSFCANCEYFDNTPQAQAEMEVVPLDQYDMDGGGRGFCTKLDFICHNLRVCQAWECKPMKGEGHGDD